MARGQVGIPGGEYVDAVAVTPADADLTRKPTKALYIGVAGDVTVRMANGGSTNITFTAVPIGVLPIRVTQVRATGTAATDITALY